MHTCFWWFCNCSICGLIMDKTTIQTLIDKVIGKKGLIRVPSWWMRKVLMQIADWVQEGDNVNDKKIVKVKKEADGKINSLETNVDTLETNLNNKIVTLETNVSNFKTDTNNILFELIRATNFSIPIKCFAVRTESLSGYVIVDGVKQSIPENTKSIILFANEFRFGEKSYLSDKNYIKEIEFSLIDTSAMTDMSYMFFKCSNLTSLDLSNFNTSAVTDMKSMFDRCSGLTSIDLSGLDTSAVTNMGTMFQSCSGLTSLDLSSFDTSAVTDMSYMFNNCESLTSLDLSSFKTSSVTDMSYMFCNCGKLPSLNLSGFDTSAVTSMSYMFYYCLRLISLDLSSFDASAVTDMSHTFDGCKSLTSLILGPNFFKTPNVTSIDFSYCTKWTNDTVVTSLVTNSYDRATAGLNTMTLQLSTETKAALTDEQKATITAKGYTIA